MERTEVIGSSQIRSIGYDEAAKRLELEFQSGGVYAYEDVPKDTYEGLLRAESKGHFFAVAIKPEFQCTRLNPKEKKEQKDHGQSKTNSEQVKKDQ